MEQKKTYIKEGSLNHLFPEDLDQPFLKVEWSKKTYIKEGSLNHWFPEDLDQPFLKVDFL